MPDSASHKRQINSNEEFFKDIAKTFNSKYFDWKITTLFYTIVHYIDAYFAKSGLHFKRHRDRNIEVQKLLNKDELSKYRMLFNASRESRYEVKCLNKSAQQYCLSVYQEIYTPLRTSLKSKIN